MPAMSSSIHTNHGTAFMMPRELANRHPTARVGYFLAEKARTRYGNWVKYGSDLISGLQGAEKMTLKRKRFVWDLLRNETLGERQVRPSDILSKDEIEDALKDTKIKLPTDWDWYRQYEHLRQLFVKDRRASIRNALVRGFHAEAITFKEGATVEEQMETIEALRQKHGLSDNEFKEIRKSILSGERVYDLDRRSNAALARPRSEVEQFLKIADEYARFTEIPDEVRSRMKEWMIDEFDFWARYGINNYAPKMMIGRHKIFMTDPSTGEDKLVAFAPDGQTALEFMRRAYRGDDELSGIPVGTEFYVEIGKSIADYDSDIQFLGSKKYATFIARMSKHLSGKDGVMADLGREINNTLRVGSEKAVPRDPHLEARMSDLEDIIEDPYKRAFMYHVRTGRNNFLLDVDEAFQTARSIDRHASQAEGVEQLYVHELGGKYMRNLEASFKGEPSDLERQINKYLAIATAPIKLTHKNITKLRERMSNENYSIFSDPLYFEALYNEDYTTRKWAEQMTTIQSAWRLGLNLAGAGINALQHVTFGPAYLATRGHRADEAITLSAQGMKDAMRYWRAVNVDPENRTAEQQELVDFVHDVGIAVTPARGLSGPGLGISGEAKPLFFSDDKLTSKVGKITEWIAMWPFAKAERSVRLSSAFTARLSAQQKNLSPGATVEYARDMINNTQFQYYDQALPPFMRGNLARVLFQFQPFVANAIKFEKDMMVGAFAPAGPTARGGTIRGQRTLTRPDGTVVSARSQAAQAWLLYNASGLTLGGMGWFVGRPMLAPLSWLAQYLTGANLEQLMMNLFDEDDDESDNETYGSYVADPELLRARDAVLYGLPGLGGIHLSGRIGVSGLSLEPSQAVNMAIGPSGAVFKETFKMLYGKEGYQNLDRQATFLGIGAATLARTSGVSFPYSMVASNLLATSLVSETGDVPLRKFITETAAGRRWMRSMLPNINKSIQFTIDAFGDGVTLDANLQEKRYSGAFNRNFQMATMGLGFETVVEAEERAAFQHALHKLEKTQATKRAYVDMAATRVMESKYGFADEGVWQIIAASRRELEDPVRQEDIIDEIERRKKSRAETIQERAGRAARTPNPAR